MDMTEAIWGLILMYWKVLEVQKIVLIEGVSKDGKIEHDS